MGTNFAVAPGEYLQEWIDGNGMSVGEFAVELGVTVAEIEDLLTGKEAIGREIACQLERVTSIPSDSWIRFELKYREDLKRMSVGSEESCTSSIHDELASLFKQGGRSWVPVYLLMRDVSENELYKPEYSSFSAWLKDEAARCGVTETLLWQRKSAGDFYHEWSSRKTGVPSLEDGKHLSELNLNLVRKIAKIDPSRGDELMYEMIEAGLSTKMLRSEWRAVRAMRTARVSAMLRKRVMPMQLEERFHAPIRRLSKKSLISCDPQDMRFAAFSERKGRLIWPIGLKPYIS